MKIIIFSINQFMLKPTPADTRAKLAQELKTISNQERELVVTQHTFARKNEQLGCTKCPKCWLFIQNCICSKATLVPSFQHKLVVIVHPKEYTLSSNTGALPQLCLPPQNVAVLVSGVLEHADQIAALWSLPNTFVLFPGKDAITFAELESSVNLVSSVNLESSVNAQCQLPSGRTYNIIIVDGTWNQAKNLERTIPSHIPRVCLGSLESVPEALQRPMRAHSDSSKVCTLAAIIQLLSEMRCDPSVMESLSELLTLKAAVICQGNLQAAPKRKREE